jgi:tetratricopeptide (TPR) repeat protein
MVASAAWALVQLGESSEALNRLHEARQLLDRLVERGMVGMCGYPSLAMGRACLLLGHLDETRRLSHLALESARSQFGIAAEARHLLGEIATQPDHCDTESGEAYYREALALANPRSMRPLAAHCHLGLGKLYRRTEKREQAEEHLATATTMYREMGMTYWLEKADAEISNLGS